MEQINRTQPQNSRLYHATSFVILGNFNPSKPYFLHLQMDVAIELLVYHCGMLEVPDLEGG